MRIPKKYGKRTKHFNAIQNERRKYILVYEGEKTEVQYFQGLIDNRIELKINPIIDLIPVLRSFLHLSHSHPLRILNLLEEHIENYDTVKVLIDKIIDYCTENLGIRSDGIYSIKMLNEDMKNYFINNRQLTLEDKIEDKKEIIIGVSDYLNKKLDLINQIDNIIKYIDEQQLTYSKDIDFLCLIIDRDKGNVKINQFDEIVFKCKNMGIKLYVTNPTFEFWLMLHSDKVFEYDTHELLENKKIGSKRFLEVELSNIFEGYKKTNIRFDKFLPYIKVAVKNEKRFCEDIENLKNRLGSNVGQLINEIIR